MPNLKPYMAFSRDAGAHEGAFLVFAHSVQEAKRVAWPQVKYCLTYDYVDLAVRLLRDEDYLYGEANPEKLAASVPHVITTPPCCAVCEMWGEKLTEGICEDCAEEVAEAKAAEESRQWDHRPTLCGEVQ